MNIITLSQFYESMLSLKEIRRKIINKINNGKTVTIKNIKELEKIKLALEEIPKVENKFKLETNQGQSILLELDYELGELKKDDVFLKHGYNALEEHVAKIHPNYGEEVEQGLTFLKKHHYKHFITDRDGTISNYCGRYQSSIQPIYNALFLSKFAKCIEGISVILTSAPLFDTGLADISIQPEGEFILAGSKGREMLINGEKQVFPIAKDEKKKLDSLNQNIEKLLENEKFAIFRYLGSGLQYKFGQTTLARQDKNKSIPEEKSNQLKDEIEKIIKNLDPKSRFFSLEDTGKDLEIMLNIKSNANEHEEFDKGHGLKFIFNQLDKTLNNEHVLVCGDTASDVPLIRGAQDLGAKVITVFVTKDETLKKSVKAICENSFFVSSPDVLIYMLYKYSKNQKPWNLLSLFF